MAASTCPYRFWMVFNRRQRSKRSADSQSSSLTQVRHTFPDRYSSFDGSVDRGLSLDCSLVGCQQDGSDDGDSLLIGHPRQFMTYDESRLPTGRWIVLKRPCGCGKPVLLERGNPNLARLLKQGYKVVAQYASKPLQSG